MHDKSDKINKKISITIKNSDSVSRKSNIYFYRFFY